MHLSLLFPILPTAANDKDTTDEKKEDTTKKSFYLQEMERYRQQACDSTNGDRPLVK